MAESTKAFFLYPPAPGLGGAGAVPPPSGGVLPEGAPAVLWGQGTPAAFAPFTTVNKGSIYMSVNQTDDVTSLYVKVDEGGDTADWVRIFVENQALIDTNDLTAAAGIVTGQIAVAARTHSWVSETLDLDVGAGTNVDHLLGQATAALTITDLACVYVEATDTTGAADASVTIGTAAGGTQVLASTVFEVSKSIGDETALSIASGAVAADTQVLIRINGMASTEAGAVSIVAEWDYD